MSKDKLQKSEDLENFSEKLEGVKALEGFYTVYTHGKKYKVPKSKSVEVFLKEKFPKG